jgi:anti-anti-sigma factor
MTEMTTVGGVNTVRIRPGLNDLNGLERPRFELSLMALVQVRAHKIKIVVDCRDVGYVDSTGIRALIICGRTIRQRGGSLVLVGVNEDLSELLKYLEISESDIRVVTAEEWVAEGGEL